MLRSILVAIDGSIHSSAAVGLAIRWARRYDALLVGIGIVDEPAIHKGELVPMGAGAYKAERDQWFMQDAERQVRGFLDSFTQRCAREGVPCKVVREVGSPDLQIVQQARLHDLVMLGQQTHFHFETQDRPDNTLREVLRRSSRPVVAVPESLQEGESILVAYDGSPQADRALQAFQALGLAEGVEVHVLSVQADLGSAERLAEQAADFLRLHGGNVLPLPLQSTMPVDKIIIAQVRELRPQLLVMGAFGRSMWREYLFGSNTTRVLETIQAPLFLCH